MALAPLEDPRELDAAPRPGLRLIRGGRPTSAGRRGAAVHARPDAATELRRSRAAHPAAALREEDLYVDVDHATRPGRVAVIEERRRRTAAIKARTAARRRRSATALVVLVSVVLLVLPIRALGAVTVSGQQTPSGVPGGLADGLRYVVQPGDTLRSIAMRINPGNVAHLEHELAASLGSATVVPGERVTIP